MRLGLFFTRNVGINIWRRDGILVRETAFYRELLLKQIDCSFFTYDTELLGSEPLLSDFKVLPVSSSWFTGNFFSRYYGKLKLKKSLAELDLIKTNQMLGASEAVVAAKRAKKPLLLRCGYLASRFAKWEGQSGGLIAKVAFEEGEAVKYAKAVIVTTESMRQYLQENYQAAGNKIYVIGNTMPEAFSPQGSKVERDKAKMRIITVGRHHRQKNYALLIEAMRGLDGYEWRAIGAGNEYEHDLQKTKELTLAVDFSQRVSNDLLPAELRAADIFVMCSKYEGHPKALLEAMACGCACIVTECPGVCEEIEDGVNGLIVRSDAGMLREAIVTLAEDQNLRGKLGAQAASAVNSHYNLKKIVEAETSLYKEII